MLSRSKIKFITSLHQKKYRQKYNKFLVEGDKMGAEILRQGSINIHSIYATASWIDEKSELLSGKDCEVNTIEEKDLKKISSLKTPNQVLVVADLIKPELVEAEVNNAFCLCLDGIRDPGNLGTILRTADWFGLPYVFCSEDSVDVYNPKVIQATMGAIFRVKCISINLHDLFWRFPDIPVFGCTLNGENLFTTEFPQNGFIIIGNESRGLRSDLFPFLSDKIRIPGCDQGAESLNAAVATGIVCAYLSGKNFK